MPANSAEKLIVHIIPDEKFIDMAFRAFEFAAPGQNRLIMIGKKRPLRYVRSSEVIFCTNGEVIKFIRSNACSAVVFHTLAKISMLPAIPRPIVVFWLGWGFDYYGRLLSEVYPDGLLLPLTKKLVAAHAKTVKQTVLRIAVFTKRAVVGGVRWGVGRGYRKAMSRIDYFAPVLRTEYELATKLNPWFTPRYIEWRYGTVEDYTGCAVREESVSGKNILVGNSADPLNNHLEVFDFLERYVQLDKKKIIVPLSYGPKFNEHYLKNIIRVGEQRFGSNFVPLIDFVDNQSYIKALQSCGYVFMNHLRQQAMGNIFILLLQGAKIYMNARSPTFDWLLEVGCDIRDGQSLCQRREGKRVDLQPLSLQSRESNITIVRNILGRDTQRKKVRHLVDVALGVD